MCETITDTTLEKDCAICEKAKSGTCAFANLQASLGNRIAIELISNNSGSDMQDTRPEEQQNLSLGNNNEQ